MESKTMDKMGLCDVGDRTPNCRALKNRNVSFPTEERMQYIQG
jgi:hypothetical protein